MFDPTQLSVLCPQTNVMSYAVLGSTNDQAIDLIRTGTIHYPSLVICENQTAGRGRPGKSWLSGTGSLTFSWCFAPAKHRLALRAAVALIAGVAVVEAIAEQFAELKLQLKWPNDVLAADGPGSLGKLAGILIETVAHQGREYWVVGIGINANNSMDTFADVDWADAVPPTSVMNLTGQPVQMDRLVSEIVQRFERWLLDDHVDPSDLLDRYQKRLAYRDQAVRVLGNRQLNDLAGIVHGVGADGSLQLRISERIQAVYNGTIRAI